MRYCNACGRAIPEHLTVNGTAIMGRKRFCPIKLGAGHDYHPTKGTPYTDPPPRYIFDASLVPEGARA